MFSLLVLLFSTVTSLNIASVPLRPRLSEAPKQIKIKSQLGISSLLKLTEKQVNNETRDGLLEIIQKAVTDNNGALVACNEVTTKLAAAGEGVAKAIIANGEEKKRLDEAAAANVRAQTANKQEKTDLDLSKAAFAGLKALIAQLGADLADPSGEILKINAVNEKNNAAAIVDNGKEAVALTEAAEAITASLANNAKELETLQSDKEANAAAVAANAAEKERLDETAAAILKIKEVIDANSDQGLDCSTLKLAAGESLCDGFKSGVWHETVKISDGTCVVQALTGGTSCSDWCGKQGDNIFCSHAQDNTNANNELGCTLNDAGHERQTTANNGCDQKWGDQICACKKSK